VSQGPPGPGGHDPSVSPCDRRRPLISVAYVMCEYPLFFCNDELSVLYEARSFIVTTCIETSKRKGQPNAPFATELPEVKHEGRITTVCLSSKTDERYIVCGSEDATLSVFDRQLNHRQSLLVGHVDKV